MSTNPDPAGQAHLNMHLAVAVKKGVQLDAEQTAAIFALIADQHREIEELRDRLRELRGERAAVVAWLREVSERRFPRDEREQGIVFRLAHEIERGAHRREEGA